MKYKLEYKFGQNADNFKWELSIINDHDEFMAAKTLNEVLEVLKNDPYGFNGDADYRLVFDNTEIIFNGDNLWILETYVK